MELVCYLWLYIILCLKHDIGRIIKKNLIYVFAKEQVKQVFTTAPFVLFQSYFSFRNHLVWAKVYPLAKREWVKLSSCGKSRCETCLNIKETNGFQSFGTKKVYKINHRFHCESNCIVYLLNCKLCGLQYVWSTVNRFHLRWNNYKCSHRVVRMVVLRNRTTSINMHYAKIITDYLKIAK